MKTRNNSYSLANVATNGNSGRMRKHKVRPYRDSKRPHLKFVVNTKEGGKRARQFFETKKDAETFVKQKNIELLNGGMEAAQFPSALRVMAGEATTILAPFGKNIADAVKFYLPHLQAKNRSCAFRALTDELLKVKEKDGAKARYLGDLRSRLRQFGQTFDAVNVSDITSTAVDEWLRALEVGPTTRNNFRRVLIVAFNFARDRGYCVANPAKEASEAKEIKAAAGILTVEQASDLLTHSDGEILPAVALGLFAGIRPESEGLQLNWSHIDFEDKTVDVEPDKTKVDSSARYVDMPDNLVAWLLPHRKHKGRVFPSLERYYALLREAREKAKIKVWPHDALRHSYGSYHYGAHRNAALTQGQMGHTNAQIFFRHYRKPMKKALADKYWRLMPSADADGKIVSMVA
jgi:integrase